MARETPNALQAFEDYWAMGDGRSLPKLAQQYAARSVAGESVPTTRENTLKMWSAGHNWQARVATRISEEAERVREEEHKRNKAFRDRVRTGIEYDVRKYLQSLERAQGPVLAEDAASLERMTKLFLALGEDPVADKTVQEHTGPGGGPVQVETNSDAVALAVIQDPGLRALAAELVGRASSGATEPGEPGVEVEPGPVGDGAAPETPE